jgi:hypothetical protein
MKKGLITLVAVMVITGLICVIGSAAADDRSIGSSFQLSGTGVIDIGMDVNTDNNHAGLSLSQSYYTPSLGMAGPSYLEYSSDMSLDMFNVTEVNSTQNMAFEEEGTAENVRYSIYMKNYPIGSVMGFSYKGDANQYAELYADNTLSEIQMEGSIVGKMTLGSKNIDKKTRVVLSSEDREFVGEFNYLWNAYSELPNYPEAEGNGDWLGCP